MAATASIKARGELAERVVEVTLDNYVTGGYALTARQLGLGSAGVIKAVMLASIIDGYQLMWDYTAAKLKAFQGDNINAAVSPGIELPNASAVLSGKVVRLVVYGQGQG